MPGFYDDRELVGAHEINPTGTGYTEKVTEELSIRDGLRSNASDTLVFFRVYAIVLSIYYFLHLFALKRASRAKPSAHPRPPEDAACSNDVENRGNGMRQDKEIEVGGYNRYSRVYGNFLETVPLVLIIFASSWMVNANLLVTSFFLVLFTVARLGFHISFVYEIAGWRSFFWWVAQVTTSAQIICLLMGSFGFNGYTNNGLNGLRYEQYLAEDAQGWASHIF